MEWLKSVIETISVFISDPQPGFITSMASGLLSGIITSLVSYYTVKKKIDADKNNLIEQMKIQINAQTKKTNCESFLTSTNPDLFTTDKFDIEYMESCYNMLCLYRNENHFSYFKNLKEFIENNNFVSFGKSYLKLSAEYHELESTIKCINHMSSEDIGQLPDFSCEQQEVYFAIRDWTEALEDYKIHYNLALGAAQKLYLCEPIEKAQPIPPPT